MVAINPDSSCREAETCYFDFLAEGDASAVPPHVIDHVRGCRHCRSRIDQLGNILTRTCLSSGISRADAAIGTMLKLHFAYLGQPVTCKIVKPFLPALLDPTLEIRIPTPIIVHLDHCKECSQDLESIRKMNLSREQLRRLSQMFSDRPKDKYIACAKAQAAINAVVNLSYHGTGENILKHLCLCSYCRDLTYEARKFAIRLLPESKNGNENLLCGQVSSRDIFDYVAPYGLGPSNDQYVKFRESLAAHVRKCPKCLGKIQDLHQTIFGIIDRPESGVVTVCHTTESSESIISADNRHGNLYSGFPICVEVSGPQNVAAKKLPISPSIRATMGTRRFSTIHLSPLVKFSGVAAAVAIAAILFLFAMPSAKAVTLEQIYEAVLKVKNVYVTSFTPEQTEPVHKKWVSRSLDIYISSAGDEFVIWDLYNGVRKTNAGRTSKIKQASLSPEETAGVEAIINSSLELIPFENMSSLPGNVQWLRLADSSISGDISILEVYDLLWTENRYSGPPANNKWRVYVDPKTNLPRRTEFYQILPGEQDYILKSFKVIDYPTEGEIRAIIEKLSF